jgi:hypothetical protein
MIAHARPLKDFLVCFIGPAVWAVHFFVVYGAEGVLCREAIAPTASMRWLVSAATLTALAALVVSLMWRAPRNDGSQDSTQRFLRSIAAWLAVLSAAAVVAVAASGLRLSACEPP